MLSYQHIYHAGNVADVHKHSILSILLAAMQEKPKPISYMETHAGRGLYNLHSAEAEKTGEAEKGIMYYMKHKRSLLPLSYIEAVEKIQDELGDDFYAGSPLLARVLLKGEGHDFNLMELHPQEYAALHKIMHGFPHVHCHKRDGYEGVLAISRPREPLPTRGFILIDPSYEEKGEYTQAANFILKLYKKWKEAVIMLWYPVLSANNHIPMLEILKNAELPKFMQSEVLFKNLPKENGMLGSGIVIINTPFFAVDEINEFTNNFSR